VTLEKFDPNQAPESYDPAKANITVTSKAVNHFKKQLADHPGHVVRVSVKRSGCTGYRYVLDMVEKADASDQCVEVTEDFQIYISEQAVPMLQGTEIDYQLQGLNRQLQFNNPNVKDMCGCGESFSVG